MRILSIIPEGGPQSMPFVRQQNKFLREKGVIVEEFFLQSRTNIMLLMRDVLEYRKQIRKFQPDVVHANYGTVTAMFASLFTGVPLVVTFRGNDLNPVPGAFMMANILRRFISIASLKIRKNVSAICVSSELAKVVTPYCKSVHVIPSGLDLEIYRPISREASRQQLNWTLDEKIVLFNCGNQPAIKRLELAQKVVHELSALRSGVRFEVLDGTLSRNDVVTRLNAADVLLVTSKNEGSPNIVKEALACNLPVVSVDVGDVQERLRGVRGCFVCADEPGDLVEHLKKVLDENQRSDGRDFVECLSWERIIEKIISVYMSTFRHQDFSDCEPL